jgi:hypothetical protein
MSNTLSLEDLQYGIHSKKSNLSSSGGKYDKSVESVISLLNSPKTEDYETYAMEAFNSYGEACQFGLFATQGLENLNTEVKILSAIKNQYSLEGLNPYKFGFEDKKNIFARIWGAIVEAFRRLITAVGNLIRQFINFISSTAMKGKTKFYEANKNEIEAAKKGKYNPTINIIEPKIDPHKISINIGSVGDKISSVGEELIKDMDGIKKLVESIKDSSGIGAIFTKFKIMYFGDPKVKFAKRLDSITSNMGTVKTTNSGFYTNASGFVTKFVYGVDKTPKQKKMGAIEFLKVCPETILSAEAVEAVNNNVSTAKKSLDSLNKGLKAVKAGQAVAEKAASEKSLDAKKRQMINSLAQYGNFSRTLNGFLVGIILHSHKEFLRQQSYAYTACRALLKGKVGKSNSNS